MEDNNSPIIDYGRKSRINLVSMISCIFLTYVLILQIVNFVNNMKTKAEEEKAKEEMLALIAEKNNQIELVTELDDIFFAARNDNIEFEHGIKIPTPNNLIDKDNIISYEETMETNNIAYRSRVVKINYGPAKSGVSLILDIFSDRLSEDYNYERILYYFDDGTEIYVRDEEEGYFSYIIFKDLEVTYGVCYGEPELKLY